MTSNKTPNSPGEGKGGGKILSQCSYCDMSFKKLEHAQRHERTHSGVRPYTCPFSSCGKSFARQDTLRRHARLHSRKDDDSKPAKGRRRRISVSSSTGTARSEASDEPTTPRFPVIPLYSTSLPSPTFHSFSRSHNGPPSNTNTTNTNSTAGGHSRRYSDATYPSLTGLSLDLSSHTIPEDPLQFGNGKLPFEMMASSPAGSTSSSSSDGDDSNDGTYSQSDQVESQYPSPAFTSYSPSSLHDSTISDLEAILANDPLHASMSVSSRHKATSTHSAGNPADDDFDFEHFAASVEGPTHSEVAAYDNLLGLGNMTSAINIEPYPTPRVAPLPIPTYHHNFSLDFDFSSVKLVEEQQRLAREQQQKKSQNRPSLSMPSLTMPSLATMTNRPTPSLTLPVSYPSAALASAYASSFPSLSVMPNTLGLHSNGGDATSAETILYAAYLKRKGAQQQQQQQLLQQQQQQQQLQQHFSVPLPAFYVPSNAQGRLQVPIPSWSPNARDALHDKREPGALFVV